MRVWIPAHPRRCAVETGGIEVKADLVGLAPGELRRFELPIAKRDARRDDAESDVSRVEPMMGERRARNIVAGDAMHERGRSQRRFARIAEIDKHAAVV